MVLIVHSAIVEGMSLELPVMSITKSSVLLILTHPSSAPDYGLLWVVALRAVATFCALYRGTHGANVNQNVFRHGLTHTASH